MKEYMDVACYAHLDSIKINVIYRTFIRNLIDQFE